MSRVLIIDDDIGVLHRLLSRLLSTAGHECRFIANAAMVFDPELNVYEKFEPEIIVTDFMMPVMDGLEFIQIARSKGVALPIILMSSDNMETKGLAAGADRFVKKDENFSAKLLAAIRELCGS